MAQAQPAVSLTELTALAQSADPNARTRLLDHMVDLCRAGFADEQTRRIVAGLFLDLTKRAERDIRLALANRLAQADWAPHDLIVHLATDEIEIASPVIAESPLLSEQDLLAILDAAPLPHRRAVAGREGLSLKVADHIIFQREDEVMTVLAGNLTAQISADGMGRMVAAARRVVALRNRLARHPRLTPDLAHALYQWVGETLQRDLAQRFELDTTKLEAEMLAATKSAADGSVDEDETGARHLVEKLHASGRLSHASLLRALRENRIGLFCVTLARLSGLEPAAIQRATMADDPELLALSCAGAGLDEAVFIRLLEALRAINNNLPGGGAEAAQRARGAFAPFTPKAASGAFRRIAAV